MTAFRNIFTIFDFIKWFEENCVKVVESVSEGVEDDNFMGQWSYGCGRAPSEHLNNAFKVREMGSNPIWPSNKKYESKS